MADPRYRYAPSGRRSPPIRNPTHTSVPVNIGGYPYSSMYGGDIHVMPISRHDSLAPRYTTEYRPPSVVPTTTTTYTVRKEPVPSIARSSSLRDSSRNRRSNTLDSAASRPIIVTTTSRPHPSVSHASTSTRAGSPPRHSQRYGDEGTYYSQPASSSGPSHRTDAEYLGRVHRNSTDRAPRPTSLYTNLPRHSVGSVDYGNEGYEYTKPGELARYDLDNDRPPRRRRDSFEAEYYRPSVTIPTDLARPNESRARGPPPTTWGLDRINRASVAGLYDRPQVRMPVPPAAPAPPSDLGRRGHLDVPTSPKHERRGSSRGPRPVSLYQESHPRYDATYRPSRDDDRHEFRDVFVDDDIAHRSHNVRGDPRDVEDSRRERRREPDDHRPPRRRKYDEEADHGREDRRDNGDVDRRVSRDTRREDAPPRDRTAPKDRGRGSSESDSDPEKKKKFRDKIASGVSAAATALGISSAMKAGEKVEERGESHARRSRESDDEPSSPVRDANRSKPSRKEAADRSPRTEHAERRHPSRHDLEIVEPPLDRPSKASPTFDSSPREKSEPDESSQEKSPSSEGGRPAPRVRRRRLSSAFRPTDDAVMEIKAKMAALETGEKVTKDVDKQVTKEPSPDRRMPPSPDRQGSITALALAPMNEESSRGREVATINHEEKQVRVVSPPRDKDERRPIKGILKAPKTAFPEEANPIREGVAPHKDDKTKSNVPTGARWTKINRKMVNPEALTVGKERFEVRDDFVIVLRVLSKEEIQAYAQATAILRERRRKESETDNKPDDDDQEEDAESRKRDHHRRRHRVEDKDDRKDRDRDRDREGDRDREREKHRHHRHGYPSDDDDEDEDRHQSIENPRHHSSHRSHKRDNGVTVGGE